MGMYLAAFLCEVNCKTFPSLLKVVQEDSGKALPLPKKNSSLVFFCCFFCRLIVAIRLDVLCRMGILRICRYQTFSAWLWNQPSPWGKDEAPWGFGFSFKGHAHVYVHTSLHTISTIHVLVESCACVTCSWIQYTSCWVSMNISRLRVVSFIYRDLGWLSAYHCIFQNKILRGGLLNAPDLQSFFIKRISGVVIYAFVISWND